MHRGGRVGEWTIVKHATGWFRLAARLFSIKPFTFHALRIFPRTVGSFRNHPQPLHFRGQRGGGGVHGVCLTVTLHSLDPGWTLGGGVEHIA